MNRAHHEIKLKFLETPDESKPQLYIILPTS